MYTNMMMLRLSLCASLRLLLILFSFRLPQVNRITHMISVKIPALTRLLRARTTRPLNVTSAKLWWNLARLLTITSRGLTYLATDTSAHSAALDSSGVPCWATTKELVLRSQNPDSVEVMAGADVIWIGELGTVELTAFLLSCHNFPHLCVQFNGTVTLCLSR